MKREKKRGGKVTEHIGQQLRADLLADRRG
jgi:hypothetical protein